MEGDPFALIESMTIAALRHRVRARLHLPARRVPARARHAGGRARRRRTRRGYLGDDIIGSGFAFDISMFRGAGAYICGEETAIFNSIEGFRGEPRNKPPFPVEVGLFGKPTARQQRRDARQRAADRAARRRRVRRARHRGIEGTKLFCVSGAVARPGVYEVEFGATLRELIELAGGVRRWRPPAGGAARRRGRRLRRSRRPRPAADVGGDSCGRHDTRLGRRAWCSTTRSTWSTSCAASPRSSATSRAGSACRAGSAPCGRRRCSHRLASTSARRATCELFRDIGQVMRDASICGLGQTAPSAIESAIDRLGVFR